MKQVIIDRILESENFPYEMVEKQLIKKVLFPIFKVKEKRFVNRESGVVTQVDGYICSNCNKQFEIQGERPSTMVECPYCKKGNTQFYAPTLPFGDENFGFKEDLQIKVDIKEKRKDVYNFRVKVPYESSGKDNCKETENLFILTKEEIFGEEFFVFRYYNVGFEMEADGTRRLAFYFDGDMIIFSKDEVQHIRNAKKSTASFENVYSYYCYYNAPKYTMTEERVFTEFRNFIKTNFELIRNINFFEKSKEKGVFNLNLRMLDSIVAVLRSHRKPSKTLQKRSEYINSIIENLETPDGYEIENRNVFYRILETDEIARTEVETFICPHCKEENIVNNKKDFLKHNKDNVEYVFCEHCGAGIEYNSFVLFDLRNNARVIKNVVQNYEDGIVVRDYAFNEIVIGNKIIATPYNNYESSNIVVVKKNTDEDKCMNNFIIIRRERNGSQYSIGKTFKNYDGSNFAFDTIIQATNFNAKWSAVDILTTNPRYNIYLSTEEIAAYMFLYKKYPVLEKMIKQELNFLVQDILKTFDWNLGKYNTIYRLEEKDVHSALRMSKGCTKLIKKDGYSHCDDFKKLQSLYIADNNLMQEDYEYIQKNSVNIYNVIEICREFGFSVHQICEYLERVRVAQCFSPYVAVGEWKDYLVAAKQIGADMTDKRVKYPAALRTEHDKTVYKKSIIDNADYEETFKRVTKEYGEKFSDKGSKFLITYPKTLSDLFEEGRELNHCVGTYGDAIKNGNSIILFVRKTEEPETPYFTLEVNPNYMAVTQFYGYSDRPPHRLKEKELISYIKDWSVKHNISY